MIFLEKGSLNKSWSSRLFSLTGFNSNSPTSIPVILIWESYPILHPPPHILSLSRLSFLNATVHARMHATYRRCFLKPSRILSVFSNPWEIWFATLTEQDRRLRVDETHVLSMPMFIRKKVSIFYHSFLLIFSREEKDQE